MPRKRKPLTFVLILAEGDTHVHFGSHVPRKRKPLTFVLILAEGDTHVHFGIPRWRQSCSLRVHVTLDQQSGNEDSGNEISNGG